MSTKRCLAKDFEDVLEYVDEKIFPRIKEEILSNKLRLKEKGEKAGEYANSIPMISQDYDATENEIFYEMGRLYNFGKDEFKKNEIYCLDTANDLIERNNYSEKMKKIVSEANADMDISTDTFDLKTAKERYNKAKQSYDNFVADNEIRNELDSNGWGVKFFFGVISAVIFVVELMMNSSLFANDLGVLGGFTTALLPATVVLALGFFLGFFWKKTKHHYVRERKNGYIGIVFLIVLLLCTNLMVVHYRSAVQQEASNVPIENNLDTDFNMEQLNDTIENNEDSKENTDLNSLNNDQFNETNSGVLALENFLNHPFNFVDIQSVFLFMMGIVFAIIHALDYVHIFSEYPGFASITRILKKSANSYKKKRKDTLSCISDKHKNYLKELNDCLDEAKRSNLQKLIFPIIEKCQKYDSETFGYISEVRRVTENLLRYYRGAYMQVAPGKVPSHFYEENCNRFPLFEGNSERKLNDMLSNRTLDMGKTQDAYDKACNELRETKERLISQVKILGGE